MASILITGCSSGIGRASAARLAAQGHRVIATARRPEGLSDLDVDLKLPLDVTDPHSIAEAVSGAGEIDVLINNAGFSLWSPAELCPDDAMRRLFDTDLLGVIRMTKAVLPVLRRRGGGKIIQISSLAARRPGPMLSLYAAAKAAVEAYSLALRFEVREFGIWVTAIGMSSVKSDIGRNRVAVEDRGTEYEPLGARVRARFAKMMSSPAEPEEVTAVIERLIADPEPPYRTYVGKEVTRIVAELSQQSDEAYEEALFAELGVDGRKQGRQC